MGKYFDKRERRHKSLPDCSKHGLVWDEQSQRCERHTGLGYVMDDELFLLEDGGYYELPYSEPVYEAPIVYEPPQPVYIEPAPVFMPESVYQFTPEPIYQAPEPIYFEPEQIYFELPPPTAFEPLPIYQGPEPVYVALDPVYQPMAEPIYEFVFEPEPIVEQTPYVEPAPIEYFASEPIYAEPEPIYKPLPVFAPEPELAVEEFFGLPYVEPVYEPVSIYEPISVFEPEPIIDQAQFFELPFIPEPAPEPIIQPVPVISDWTFCAPEWGRCNFPDTREVRYGHGSTWTAPRIFTGGVDCTNAVFGDPIKGTVKGCQTRVVAQPAPIPEPIFELEPIIEEFFPLPFIPFVPELAPVVEEFFALPFIPEPTIEEQITIPEWPMPIEAFQPVTVGIDKSENMYTDDFGNTIESGVYADPGIGGDSFAVDYASVYAPIDFAPVEPVLFEPQPFFDLESSFEPQPFMPPLVSDDLPFAPYEPEPLPFEPLPGELPGLSSQELFFDYLDLYIGEGYSPDEAITLAEESVAAGSIEIIPTLEQGPLPEPLSSELPFIPFVPEPFIPEQFFPLPFVPEEIPPAPALGPCNTPTGLPGVCAQGFYHPLNSPCDCVPFPPAPSPTQQPRPPTQQQPQQPTPRPPAPTAVPRPPAQQVCPTTHCKHPTTGQCIPIPQGYARDPQTQICTALTAQASPIPIPTEAKDLFDNLKELPWWVWAAGAGLLLLSQSGGNGGRQTTITHRRA